MTNNIITKYIGLTNVGTPLASDIITDYVDLSIYNYVDFVLSISEGIEASITIKMVAKKTGSNQATNVSFREKLGDGVIYENIDSNGKTFSIAGINSRMYGFRVSTANLAKGEFTNVALNIEGAVGSDLKCYVMAVLYEPRYSDFS